MKQIWRNSSPKLECALRAISVASGKSWRASFPQMGSNSGSALGASAGIHLPIALWKYVRKDTKLESFVIEIQKRYTTKRDLELIPAGTPWVFPLTVPPEWDAFPLVSQLSERNITAAILNTQNSERWDQRPISWDTHQVRNMMISWRTKQQRREKLQPHQKWTRNFHEVGSYIFCMLFVFQAFPNIYVTGITAVSVDKMDHFYESKCYLFNQGHSVHFQPSSANKRPVSQFSAKTQTNYLSIVSEFRFVQMDKTLQPRRMSTAHWDQVLNSGTFKVCAITE